ncbi:VIT family protein [Nitzschia inconspicua]|uniref:VIT family protein n=1 Tax=Nitzschia inconspicua TaxID=303405 RepID=A0A9K3Q5B1_9STRA|nr:VIT family protein [Nitzschia inconspicua]
MSATPVSIDSPPTSAHIRSGSEQERDLQAKMQHLISLQYQEQEQHYYDNGTPSSAMALDRKSFSRGSKQQNLQSFGQKDKQQQQSSSISEDYTDEDGYAPHSSSRDNVNAQSIRQPDVGKGTIVFSGKLREFSGSNGSSPTKEYLQQQQEQLQKLQQHLSPHIQQSSSGTSRGKLHPKPPPPPSSRSSSANPPHQIYAGYGSLPQQPQNHQHHEFHYGNPDYHDPYDKSQSPAKDLLYNENDDTDRHDPSQEPCCCEQICCLYRPIVDLLGQENLHRSFCYGAIDGLLTGSGIVSAFWGLGVLTVQTSWDVRLAVTCLAVAACVADSLCMALGHVWTTYIVTSNHAEERARERQLLETNKSQSKGKLVDMLLARGMLKIDAMSLADTLEGYPDLLVSALVGDSLLAGGEEGTDDEQTEDGYSHLQGYQIDTPEIPQHQHGKHPPTTGGEPFGSFGSWRFPSYGQFNIGNFESESRQTNTMLRESQKEGFFMMVGFSMFAVLPSLLWLFLPLCFKNTVATGSNGHTIKGGSMSPTSASANSPIVALPSLIIFILSAVVWCLGVWKARFVDSNWIIFGMETIAVLLVCIFSAYCVAMLLVVCLGFETGQGDKLLPNFIGFPAP